MPRLALLAGVSLPTLRKVERSDGTSGQVSTASSIAEALGVRLDDLLRPTPPAWRLR